MPVFSLFVSVLVLGRSWRNHGSILVADDVLDLKFLPLDATLGRGLTLALLVLLILRRYLALLLMLAHLELYEAVLSLGLVRVARRRPS